MGLTPRSASACVPRVTENDPQASSKQRKSEAIATGSLPKRIFEFFWRGTALARRREDVARTTERAFALAQRASASGKVAGLALSAAPLEPSSEGIACESYRQSAYWAACALRESRSSSVAASYDESVWSELDDPSLIPNADESTRASLRDLVREASFVQFAELPPEERNRVRVSLQALASGLLAKFGELNTVRAIYRQRARRLGLLVVSLVGIALIGLWIRELREQSRELADGKSWRASSNYGGGCRSPRQDCKEKSGYFFHTAVTDKSPWVEFDLATTQPITRVEVENRRDCCFDRASPLVVEVSVDHQKWQEVARHEGEFESWRTIFPAASARWVRLRVLKTTALHLYRVRIFP